MPLSVGKGTAMRRVLSIFTVFACFCFLALALDAQPALSQRGLVLRPPSRAAAPLPPGWVSSPPTRDAAKFDGPAIVRFEATTALIHPGQQARVDAYGNVRITQSK